jgi:malic enzyme
VVLAGFINAAKLSSAASNQPLTSHRILFLGAGSAGVGVAMQLMSFFTLHGLTADEARERIYLVDSQGLVFDERGSLAEHKKCQYFLNPRTSSHCLIWFTCSLLSTRLQGPKNDEPP